MIFITHNVVHTLTVGDHFAVLIRGSNAADFTKGEKTRDKIADLMAGGEAMADFEILNRLTIECSTAGAFKKYKKGMNIDLDSSPF